MRIVDLAQKALVIGRLYAVLQLGEEEDSPFHSWHLPPVDWVTESVDAVAAACGGAGAERTRDLRVARQDLSHCVARSGTHPARASRPRAMIASGLPKAWRPHRSGLRGSLSAASAEGASPPVTTPVAKSAFPIRRTSRSTGPAGRAANGSGCSSTCRSTSALPGTFGPLGADHQDRRGLPARECRLLLLRRAQCGQNRSASVPDELWRPTIAGQQLSRATMFAWAVTGVPAAASPAALTQRPPRRAAVRLPVHHRDLPDVAGVGEQLRQRLGRERPCRIRSIPGGRTSPRRRRGHGADAGLGPGDDPADAEEVRLDGDPETAGLGVGATIE